MKNNTIRMRAVVQAFEGLPISITPIVIALTTCLMYRTIHKFQQQLRQFGAIRSRKRSVLYTMAMSYTMSWSLMSIPIIVAHVATESYASVLLATIFAPPLQGLFNSTLYIMPKVRIGKNSTRNTKVRSYQKSMDISR